MYSVVERKGKKNFRNTMRGIWTRVTVVLLGESVTSGLHVIIIMHVLYAYVFYTTGARGHLHARECHAVSHLIWIEGPPGHHKNQGGRLDHWQQGRYSMINARRRLSKWRINLGVGQVHFDLERSVFDGIWWMTTQMKALSVSFTMAGKAFWFVKIRGH